VPNEEGRFNKEEAYGTGLPIYIPASKRWTERPYPFAILLSKSRCADFKTPITSQERPKAFLYAANAGAGTNDLKHRYVPLYDRTEALRDDASGKLLYEREIMRGGIA
jgi:hypothetical protein